MGDYKRSQFYGIAIPQSALVVYTRFFCSMIMHLQVDPLIR